MRPWGSRPGRRRYRRPGSAVRSRHWRSRQRGRVCHRRSGPAPRPRKGRRLRNRRAAPVGRGTPGSSNSKGPLRCKPGSRCMCPSSPWAHSSTSPRPCTTGTARCTPPRSRCCRSSRTRSRNRRPPRRDRIAARPWPRTYALRSRPGSRGTCLPGPRPGASSSPHPCTTGTAHCTPPRSRCCPPSRTRSRSHRPPCTVARP